MVCAETGGTRSAVLGSTALTTGSAGACSTARREPRPPGGISRGNRSAGRCGGGHWGRVLRARRGNQLQNMPEGEMMLTEPERAVKGHGIGQREQAANR